jgi:RND superfamily putative drug exporter
MLTRLASLSVRRRWTVVGVWIVALVGSAVLASSFGGDHRVDYRTPNSDAAASLDVLNERLPQLAGDQASLVVHATAGIADPAVAAQVAALAAKIDAVDHVVAVTPTSVSADGRTSIATIQFDTTAEKIPQADLEKVLELASASKSATVDVELGGYAIQSAEMAEGSSESIGLIAAAIILLIAFGSVVAAGLPITVSILGLGVGLSIGSLLSAVIDVPSWGTSLATMIGIGVGIDYALFIVTRFRSSLADGMSVPDAVTTSVTTAGRSVLFAGGTVVVSLLGLGVMGLEYMWGAAIAMSVTVAVMMFAAVSLLPALLALLGHRVDRLRLPFVGRDRGRDNVWARLAGVVQRRPWVMGSLALGVLIVMSVPLTSLRYGYPDGGSGDEALTSRRAYDLVTDGFGPGANGPLLVSIAAPSGSALPAGAVDALRARVAGTPGVAAVTPPLVAPTGDAAVLTVVPTSGPQQPETADLVRRLRSDVAPSAVDGVQMHVGGASATYVDETDYMGPRFPWFIAIVLLLSFVLLLAVFRAVLVAAKAVLMNLLSLGAAFGAIGLAAQGGWFGGLIGINQATPIPVWLPIMMFAVLFGLSMDYEVFLLSRIREAYNHGHDNAAAVRSGMASSGRVITAAAAIMVTVFGAYMFDDGAILKLAGLGLATAVLVDATIVRMVLVPATMDLLGDRNWWMPRWLQRWVPHVDVEGSSGVVGGAVVEAEPVRVPVGAGR